MPTICTSALDVRTDLAGHPLRVAEDPRVLLCPFLPRGCHPSEAGSAARLLPRGGGDIRLDFGTAEVCSWKRRCRSHKSTAWLVPAFLSNEPGRHLPGEEARLGQDE